MAQHNISSRIILLNDIKANWDIKADKFVLLKGEIGIESDTNKFKIGNGVSTWAELDYYAGGSSGSGDAIIPIKLADLLDDETHRTVTDVEKETWNNKVDKVDGKGLSTNDFTNEDKTKLDGLSNFDDSNVVHKTGEERITDKKIFDTIEAKIHLQTEGTFRSHGDAEFFGNITKNGKELLTGDDLPTDYISFKKAQTLTEEQKAQARENIGAGSGSFSGSYKELTNKPYDVVITSQAEFEALIASSDWLGAKSVAFIGNGGSLQFTASDTIKIPQSVMQIQGFNNATIKITPISSSYGIWYSTKPTGSGYSMNDIKVIIPSTSYSADAVARMVNLTNVDVEVEEGNTTVQKVGFSGCDNLINCKSNVPTLGFSFCNYLVNCIGTNTRETGYGYLNCSYGVNCVGTTSGGEQWLNKELHPIGSIYMSVDTTSPASLYGGTWERIAQGRAIFGAGTLNDIDYEADGTIDAGLPNITGSFGADTSKPTQTGAFRYGTNSQGSSTDAQRARVYTFDASLGETKLDGTLQNDVYGKSNTVQPNAYVVYVWKRVA